VEDTQERQQIGLKEKPFITELSHLAFSPFGTRLIILDVQDLSMTPCDLIHRVWGSALGY
jgi:hypothetical protein